jgi:NAD(P)-dependent dehydrogenase (short-subunit alcohol dehydrogenase family)
VIWVEPEDRDRTLAVNNTGQFNCARLAVRHLQESDNASIISLSSAAGSFGFPLRFPYSAAKWAAVGLTKTVAMELGPLGIRVNVILPGVVEGERIRRVVGSKGQARAISYEEMQDEFLQHVSMRTSVTPQQIAFLYSPRGRTVSGQAISIVGGTQTLA